MNEGARNGTWRRLALSATHPAVPLLVAAAWLTTVGAAAALAPASVRGPAMLAAGIAVIIIAYLRLPKPTLAAFALVILFYDTFSVWLGGGAIEQMDEAIVPILFVIGWWRLKPWKRGLFEPVRDGALLLALGLGVISSVVNGVPHDVWLISLLLMVKVVAFLQVVIWHDYAEADVRQVTFAVAAVAVAVLVLGAIELIDGPGFRAALNLPTISNLRGQLPGIKAIFYHPVLFSWFCTFAALFLFAFHTVYRRWPLLIAAFLFSAGSFLGGRRRGIAGLVLALVGGFVADRQNRSWRAQGRRWLPAAASFLALAVFFLPSLIQLVGLTIDEPRPPASAPAATAPAAATPSGQRATDPPTANVSPPPSPTPGPTAGATATPGASHATSPGVTPRPGAPTGPNDVRTQDARLALYLTSIDVARDRFPLGAGLGRYGSPLSRSTYSPVYVEYGLNFVYGLGWEHTDYITDTFWPQILGEAGVFGLLAYGTFVAAIGLSLWRATRVKLSPFVYAFVLATWMVFLQALVETLASSMFHSPPRIYLLFGCVGMTIALARAAVSREQAQPPSAAKQ